MVEKLVEITEIVGGSAACEVPAFKLSGVSYQYPDGVLAIRNVSLEVNQGELLAIVGANGSGKSTLLKIMDGLALPDSGRLEAFGQEIDATFLHHPESVHRFRRQVGFVFQNSDAQLFSPTVRDEIAFGPLQMELPVSHVERRISDMAALLDIEQLIDRPPYHLSGGEKKKVAIASVLAIGPDALLFDEPTNGLDPRTQSWLADFLTRLKQAGKTIVIATHDLELVARVADRVAVLNEDHSIETIGDARPILNDIDLLVRVNLVHEHVHWHGNLCHIHPHYHGHEHEHTH